MKHYSERRICRRIRRFYILAGAVFAILAALPVRTSAGPALVMSGHVLARQPLVVVSHRVPVTIEIGNSLSSRRASAGDTFSYRIVGDVRCHGALVLPDGMEGTGTVESVRRARKFGRDGYLNFRLGKILAVDGTAIELGIPSGSSGPGENEGLAAGAALVGLAALGPLGLAGGALVRGDNVTLEQGKQLTAYPVRPVLVRGIVQ